MDGVCTGCLARDRETSPLPPATKQIYLDVVAKLQEPASLNAAAVLCWECHADINRFVKFKEKVKISHDILKCAAEKNYQNCIPQSSLKSCQLHQFHMIPDTSMNEASQSFEIIKTEPNWPETSQLKIQIEDSNSDSEVLADFIEKEKKIKKKTKAKKKISKRVEIKNEIYIKVVLDEKEIEEERMCLASKDEYANSLYKCVKCILPFPNPDDFKDHIDLKHDLNTKHKCKICECGFSNEMSFNYHKNKHVKRYECIKCKDRFTTVKKAERHYESHLYASSYKCDECDDEFGAYHDYEEHRLNSHRVEHTTEAVSDPSQDSENTSLAQQEQPGHACPTCCKTFKWKTSLRKHLETHSIAAGHKRCPRCETCRLSFTTSASLQKHMKCSSKHQMLLKLRKNPPSSAEEAASMKLSHQSEAGGHGCALCGQRYQWRGNLTRHMETHRMRASGELVCVPCNQTFSSQATFQRHLKLSRRHVSEEDFQFVCPDCNKKFATKTRLRDHRNWEHLRRFTHVCAVCDKVFKSHTTLYLHRRVVHRKDVVEHLCDHCGKGFPTKTKLQAHVQALHLGKAAYSCSVCLAKFSWSSCLARHMKTMHKAQA